MARTWTNGLNRGIKKTADGFNTSKKSLVKQRKGRRHGVEKKKKKRNQTKGERRDRTKSVCWVGQKAQPPKHTKERKKGGKKGNQGVLKRSKKRLAEIRKGIRGRGGLETRACAKKKRTGRRKHAKRRPHSVGEQKEKMAVKS